MNWKHIIGALALFIASPASAGFSGCYIGAQAGMASTNSATSIDLTGTGSLLDVKGLGSSGGLFGVHAGCDVKIQQFVVGAFGDYGWHNQVMEISSPLLATQIARLEVDTQWTIGGRAGIAFTDSTLVYGLVGWTRVETSDLSILGGALVAPVKAFDGWTFGGGISTEIMPNIRLSAEYRYAKLDKQDIVLVPAVLSVGVRPESHTAMARFSYVFDFSGK